MKKEFGIEISEEELLALEDSGRILFILDGFDELMRRADGTAETTGINLVGDLLYGARRNKVILTSRTGYLSSPSSHLPNSMTVAILPWGERELDDYLQRRVGERAEEVKEKIGSTYNLEELAQTPLFLNMMADHVLDLGPQANPGRLYTAYTDVWFNDPRPPKLMKTEQRKLVMREAAFELFASGQTEPVIKTDDLHRILEEKLPRHVRTGQDLEAYETDFRTCTFLVPRQDGFAFSHRSFQEFFTAQKLVEGIQKAGEEVVSKRLITPEIADFLGHIFEHDERRLRQIMKWLKESDDSNVLTLCVALRQKLGEAGGKAGAFFAEECRKEDEMLRRVSQEQCPKEIPGMVYIPHGKFVRGGVESLQGRVPQRIHLDGYYISDHPVTNAEYELFDPEHKRDELSDEDNQPVVSVSWEDAEAYCEWLTKEEGEKEAMEYRLPTEAQWEKAARGLFGRTYPWGDEPPDESRANYARSSQEGDRTTPIKRYPANCYGLYDMAGNVWEWCADWHDKAYYKSSPVKNPKGPDSGSVRVSHGGGLYNGQYLIRASLRGHSDPSNRYLSLGFRCAGLVTP